jgi:ribosomal protein L11 methyltransferase
LKRSSTASKIWVWRKLIQSHQEDIWRERIRWVGEDRAVVTTLPSKRTSRLEVYCHNEKECLRLKDNFGGEMRAVRSHEWLDTQKRSFCLPVAGRICVASERDAIPARHAHLPHLLIPAGIAFGTGEHPTTRMCLRQLALAGDGRRLRVLDAGTGSGILALAAALLGHEVDAIDFDPDAIKTARENAASNGHVPKVRWHVGRVSELKPKHRFDMIVANLFADIHIEAMPFYRKWITADGVLIYSGVLHAQEIPVQEAARQAGFELDQRLRVGKWICAVARRS